MHYELGYYGAKLIASFEFPHGIQTRPERDALGIPTIMGMTSLPDGRKVTMDMEFTETEIVALYGQRLAVYVDSVNRSVRAPIHQHQFDALVAMCFNTGVGAFEDEPNNTVLRMTNKGEFDNAAAAFGKWTYGTLHGGKPGPDGELARGPDVVYSNGQKIELSGGPMEKGQKWKKAFGGLYRRHVSEALLYCSLDWERAAHPKKIQLTKRTEPREFGFYDVVKFKTPWKKIKDDAKYDVLPVDPVFDEDVFEPEPVIHEPVIEEAMPESKPTQKPPQPYRDFDPAAEPKDIAFSKRVHGLFMIVIGWFTMMGEAIAGFPFVSELASMSPLSVSDWRIGMLILMAGLLLHWYGKVKAKSPLK